MGHQVQEMLTAIEYIMEHDTVMICRCYGTGSYLTLPDEIAGYPVTALADHCFAPEPSYALRHVPKRLAVPSAEDGRWVEAVLPGTGQTMADEAAGGQPALCAKLLESISLPGHLKRIGNYAFYACHHLREIHFPASLENLGGGTFVAAYHLERFYFSKEKGQISPPCMKDVLGDYRYEIEVIAEDQPEHKAEGTEEKPQERTADLEDPGR